MVGSLGVAGFLIALFLFALYCSFNAATSSSWLAKYEALCKASSSDTGVRTASSSLNLNENQTPFFNAARATISFGCEILALISRNLFMYALKGLKGACLRFQRSASVTLVSMKTEYCYRNVDTNWVKLSIEFSSSPTNHSSAAPVRFSTKKRQYPASFSSSVRCALDIARRKARTWSFGSVVPAYSGNFSFPA